MLADSLSVFGSITVNTTLVGRIIEWRTSRMRCGHRFYRMKHRYPSGRCISHHIVLKWSLAGNILCTAIKGHRLFLYGDCTRMYKMPVRRSKPDSEAAERETAEFLGRQKVLTSAPSPRGPAWPSFLGTHIVLRIYPPAILMFSSLLTRLILDWSTID